MSEKEQILLWKEVFLSHFHIRHDANEAARQAEIALQKLGKAFTPLQVQHDDNQGN